MGPLDGVVVADFSRVLAGPYATMMLADMGATVIKVERPEVGDDTRSWGPPYTEDGTATYFASVNRNKQSIQLDLRNSDDKNRAYDLIERADILIENFRPGTMEKLGFGYETLAKRNPSLIYASLSGFGSGEGADIGGYDLVVQAVGGLMSITGSSQEEPVKVGVALVDVLTGLHLGMGVLAALRHRDLIDGEKTGQHIEINLLSTALSSLVNQASAYINTGTVARPLGNKHPSISPYEVFTTGNGELAVAAGNDSLFKRFCQAIDREDLAQNPEYATNDARVARREHLAAEIEHTLVTSTSEHWFSNCREYGVPAGPVNDIAQAFKFAEELGLNPVQNISGTRVVSNPLNFSKTPVEYKSGPPPLG